MNKLFIYIPRKLTHRQKYTCDFVFEHYLGLNIHYVHDANAIPENMPILNYSHDIITKALSFRPSGLLSNCNIEAQKLDAINFMDFRVLFPIENKQNRWVFDPLSCVFYMISRYEEYLDSPLDVHGRFSYKSSISYTLNQIRRPWVEEIMIEIGKDLEIHFPSLSFKKRKFEYLATYDIDIPYAHKGRSIVRSMGTGFQQFFQGKSNIKNWLSTIIALNNKRIKDPYDSFEYLEELSDKFGLKSIYFFLMSNKGPNNPSLKPNSIILKELIENISKTSRIGIHPSYDSSKERNLPEQELKLLAQLSNTVIEDSRQHFLRSDIPNTWNQLADLGIKNDYSMGYADISGFRAGLSIPFPAYDLKQDRQIDLLIHPFCWMDATYRYYQSDSNEKAILSETLALIEHLKKVQGKFVTIFHNDNFTEWNKQRDFRKIYMTILSAIFPE